jgi:SAM-dependent methyltransferase
MSQRVQAFRQKHFADTPNDWQAYHNLLSAYVPEQSVVLEVGCGKGLSTPYSWNEHPGVTLVGIDPDPDARQNPQLDDFSLLTDELAWPVEDGRFDMVIARYVLEHVFAPDAFFESVFKALKPNGVFLFLTPNLRHPAMAASGLIPHAIKTRFLSFAKGMQDDDVFPSHYRMNVRRELEKLGREHGFEIEHLETNEFEPTGYLDFSMFGFLLAYAYYVIATRTGLERHFGMSITGVFRKP